MKFSDKIQDIWRAATGKPQLWRTPYGNIELVRNAKEARTLLAQLQRTTEALTRSDMRKWHRAWQQAISVEFPDRRDLYDVYRDAMIDAHLSGCIDQRIGFVLARSFNIETADGEPQPELHHYFEQEWFDQFCRMVLLTPYWGHSLIEVGNVVTDGDGCPSFDGVHLIDRRYVIPEHHRVVTDLGQTWETGIDYHERPWSDRLVDIGQPTDLGLLLKAAQHTIPKKNVLAAWDLFSEVFGIPLRVARTASRNQKDVDRIDQMMQRMGMASYAVLPLDTEIQIVENAKSDAFNVYDKRIDRANSELSKLIIGQTMTIEDGSSLSQSQTHLEVFQNIVEQDASLLAHTVNNQLLPLMVRMGWPLQGVHFAWDETVDYTPEQQIQYEQMVADRYEVDPAYFADKYSMPVGERIQQPSLFGSEEGREKSEEGREKSEESDPKKQLARPFFRLSPDDYKGLHLRYTDLLKSYGYYRPYDGETIFPEGDDRHMQLLDNDTYRTITQKFDNLMRALFRQKGAVLDINILASDEAQDFITTHAGVLDSTFEKVKMSDKMRERLTRSDYIFSGIKTFHELNEAFPSLLDENGDRKTFEHFLNDVQKVNDTYNRNYLRAEYNFVHQSAQMAAKWEQYSEDGDRYYLQYRTAHDDKVRPEHAALEGVTLPMSDPFWETYYPPNGWNCRCTVAQVRKQKYPATDHNEAMSRGQEALDGERFNIFRFNSGKQGKTMPDYNPYTIQRCNDCSIAKDGNVQLSFVPEGDLCAACIRTRECWNKRHENDSEIFYECQTSYGKVRVSSKHGKNEKRENVRVATYLAEKYGYEIDLIANLPDRKTADSFNKTLGIEQEYKVNTLPTKSSIDNLIRKGAKQADSVVLIIDSRISLDELSSALHDRVRRTRLDTVMIVSDSKGRTYTRSEIIADGFKIRQADLE